MRYDQYVIECRHPDGTLDFSGLQPEKVFGLPAITGITDDQMAKAIWRTHPDAVLTGDSIPAWPRLLDPRWTARRKTW